ncbi:hypothetical protein C3L29_038085 [Pseudomonas sp. MWU12-2534b]|nr:hypothetical protein C3L29_038085 [Pseudomonas sp. MWU12-2534b]
MAVAVLLEDELAQALGFFQVALIQAVGVETGFGLALEAPLQGNPFIARGAEPLDWKSTRLISYAVFCLKKKTNIMLNEYASTELIVIG